MSTLGKSPQFGIYQRMDAITGTSDSSYTLKINLIPQPNFIAEQLIVSVNGVIQAPNDAYTVSGSTITFSENLVTGDVIDFIVALGEVGNTVTPVDGSVDINKMSNSIMKNNAIRVNDTTLTSNVTIAADENAMVAGAFTIGSGVTLTVNGTFTVV